jgi:mitochondrial chaperone BCS1
VVCRRSRWHSSRGIPWKLGIILHGQPGTGKTSLIHALASDLGFDIKYIKSLHGLGAAFMSGTKNDLFVIEDIDTIANGLEPRFTEGEGREQSL